jgi:hypothetical protein
MLFHSLFLPAFAQTPKSHSEYHKVLEASNEKKSKQFFEILFKMNGKTNMQTQQQSEKSYKKSLIFINLIFSGNERNNK